MPLTTKSVLDVLIKSGKAKAERPASRTLILAIMAGAYIGFAAYLAIIASTGWTINGEEVFWGVKKFMLGAVFSTGLMLVLIPGGDLFTGNILMVHPLIKKQITLKGMMKNWSLVWLGNLAGALLLAWLLTGPGHLLSGAKGVTALHIAHDKASLGVAALLTRSILANWIVCLAVIMALAAENTSGKILSILFPIAGFAAAGFEHSIANMFFIPAGLMIQASTGVHADLTLLMAVRNIGLATVGNIIGGAVPVAMAYGYVYRTD